MPGGDGGIRASCSPRLRSERNVSRRPRDRNGHLRSGSGSSDLTERLVAGQNVAYFIDYLLNGAGTGTPDRMARYRLPQVTSVLGAATPVMMAAIGTRTSKATGGVGRPTG